MFYGFIILIVALLSFRYIKSHKTVPIELSKTILMQHPNWKIGDWFEILYESDDGHNRPFNYIHRYQFVKKISLLGIECIEMHHVPNGMLSIIHSNTFVEFKDYRIYYIQTSDMNLAAISWPGSDLSNQSNGILGVDTFGSPVDVSDCFQVGMFPVFPLTSGITKRINTKLQRDHLLLPSNIRIHDRHGVATEQICEKSDLFVNGNKVNAIKIKIRKSICKWVPSQLWWAQCQNSYIIKSGTNKGHKVTFRASLIATSADGILNYPLPDFE